LRQRAKRHAECFGSDHYDVNVIALWALERAKIKTHTCGHDAGKHHVSIARRAGRALKLNVDVLGQKIGVLHDASLIRRERNTLSHRYCLDGVAVMEGALVIEFSAAVPY
jgi:hypothetical protein